MATVGNYSGIPGSVFAEGGRAIQAWGRWVNQRGGIQGRPVRVLFLDDGSDPARHLRLVKDAVEREGAVAIVSEYASLTGQASVDYLTTKRIPVIGGAAADAWFETNATYFPVMAVGQGYHFLTVAATVKTAQRAGLQRMGVIYCVEAAACTAARDSWPKYATQLGMEVVQVTGASLAQPDFTAECLNFRNRGAEVVMILLDGNSVRRLAGSCARQGYRPLLMQPSDGFEQAMLGDQNLNGLVGASGTYPITLEGMARGSEARAAIRTQMGDVDNFVIVGQSWLAGEVLRAALEAVPASASSETVLEGLWRIKGDDFGGLTAPLTYTRGARSNQQPVCYFDLRINQGSFESPDGGTRHCVPFPG